MKLFLPLYWIGSSTIWKFSGRQHERSVLIIQGMQLVFGIAIFSTGLKREDESHYMPKYFHLSIRQPGALHQGAAEQPAELPAPAKV